MVGLPQLIPHEHDYLLVLVCSSMVEPLSFYFGTEYQIYLKVANHLSSVNYILVDKGKNFVELTKFKQYQIDIVAENYLVRNG